VAAQRFSRRWLLVAAGAAGLVGAGTISLPVAAADVDPAVLRERILAGVPPYVGYAESTGRLGLPQIPQLESVTALLTGTTRIRAFVAGADRWRVDELTAAGERDTYRLDGIEYMWDFGADQLIRVTGSAPLRLPRAADLLPPGLAARLLRLAPADPVTALPARRIANRTAAGLRLTPADPDTTVGSVDIWADPATALPLRVEVAARTGPPLLFTELIDVAERAPEPADLTPTAPPGASAVTATAADVSGALRTLGAPPPPDRLAGRDRVPLAGTPDAQLPGVGLYGSGLAGFALIPVNREIAERAVDGASVAGARAVEVPSGRAVRLATPLVSVAVRARGRGGVLLIGTVAPEVLEQALRELPERRRT
jgi:hypothetical protein